MRVLVVGGAGKVGSMVCGALAATHHLTVADRVPNSTTGPAEFVAADVTDYVSMCAAAQDQDAVIYLAMGHSDDVRNTGGGVESHFDVSVKGLYLTLRAAADAGVRKVVHASSLSIFDAYLKHGHELQDRVPDATSAYGLTKRLGEQVCESVARERGLQVVSLRLCGPLPDNEWAVFHGRCPQVMTAGADVATAFARALEYDAEGHETFIITGDHEHRFIDHSHSRDRLGWEPIMRREEEPHSEKFHAR